MPLYQFKGASCTMMFVSHSVVTLYWYSLSKNPHTGGNSFPSALLDSGRRKKFQKRQVNLSEELSPLGIIWENGKCDILRQFARCTVSRVFLTLQTQYCHTLRYTDSCRLPNRPVGSVKPH